MNTLLATFSKCQISFGRTVRPICSMLVEFFGISNFVGYLTSNPFLRK